MTLVLADHNLPQFDALGALAVLRESGLDIPLVIVSGSIGEETAVALMKAGANDYVLKDKLLRLAVVVEHALQDAEDRRIRTQTEDSLTLARYSVDHASDYTFWINSEGLFIDASESAGARLGYSRADLLNMSVFDVSVNLSREAWADRWREIRECGSLTFEQPHQTREGEIFPAEVSSTIFEREGREYCLAIVRDITDRKCAEEHRLALERQLQQSQKLESLGVLAGGIAHDFNNILTSVLGNAELALAELSPSVPGRENLLEITQASRRAAALCRQMLAYSGRGHFVIEPIDLAALIEDMLDLLRAPSPRRPVLNLRPGEGSAPHGGRPQSAQPGDHEPGDQRLRSHRGAKRGHHHLHRGQECSAELPARDLRRAGLSRPASTSLWRYPTPACGMDAETQERLFEPFFTTKFTGRAWDSPPCWASCAATRARSSSAASRAGHHLQDPLPRRQSRDGARPRQGRRLGGRLAGRGHRPCWWTTRRPSGRWGARMLEQLGFRVLTAADGREALAVYRAHMDEITLVLLDLTMPHMDGEETFRELRRLDPEVRVVMSSGYTEQDVTSRFAGKGLAGFLQKPYTLAELTGRLQAALAG